jgi:hypothetical protein
MLMVDYSKTNQPDVRRRGVGPDSSFQRGDGIRTCGVSIARLVLGSRIEYSSRPALHYITLHYILEWMMHCH